MPKEWIDYKKYKNMKVIKGKVIFDIKAGDLCPYCKVGDVIKRKGRFGSFYGCSQFPNCGFTQPLIIKHYEPQRDIIPNN